MRRILINATEQEEIRVAMVDGQYLYDLDIEHTNHVQKKSNIYKGTITRIEPSLNAAFVDYGAERHGFLPFKEISHEYWKKTKTEGRPSIKEVMRKGQEVLIQIDKEERGNKGASLTTYISLAGRFLVLMPNNPKAGGVSRRIEGEDRHRIKQILNELDIENGGAIVRTAGLGRELEELSWDLDYLKMLWSAIQFAHKKHKAPTLLYQESNLIIRTLRDYFRPDVGEIIFDKESIYNQACEFVKAVMPHNINKLKLYRDKSTPLFSRYQIEHQIESAFEREVTLPSGGAIVIDHTEALISIDINSARATKGGDIEETALNTNLEAAEEIARQLRLRDLGGLVVIDFIDMMPNRNQRSVEKRLREKLKIDRARVQIGRISRFGLLEMSRQRLRPSLDESSQIVCPRCSGHGTFRGVESLALSILRLIEDEAMKNMTKKVTTQVPVDVACFLLNEKRPTLNKLQEQHDIDIVILPNPHMVTPHYEIERNRVQDISNDTGASYDKYHKVQQSKQDSDSNPVDNTPRAETPVVAPVMPDMPMPSPANTSSEVKEPVAENTSFIRRVFGNIFANKATPATEEVKAEAKPSTAKPRTQNNNHRSQQNNNNRQKRNPNQNQGQKPNNQQKRNPNQNQGQQQPNNQQKRNPNQNQGQQQPNNQQKRNPNQNQGQQQPNNQQKRNPNQNQGQQPNNQQKRNPNQNQGQQQPNNQQERSPNQNQGQQQPNNQQERNPNQNQRQEQNGNRKPEDNQVQNTQEANGNTYSQRNKRTNRYNSNQRRKSPPKHTPIDHDQMDMTPIEIKIPAPTSTRSRKKPPAKKKRTISSEKIQSTTAKVAKDLATEKGTNVKSAKNESKASNIEQPNISKETQASKPKEASTVEQAKVNKEPIKKPVSREEKPSKPKEARNAEQPKANKEPTKKPVSKEGKPSKPKEVRNAEQPKVNKESTKKPVSKEEKPSKPKEVHNAEQPKANKEPTKKPVSKEEKPSKPKEVHNAEQPKANKEPAKKPVSKEEKASKPKEASKVEQAKTKKEPTRKPVSKEAKPEKTKAIDSKPEMVAKKAPAAKKASKPTVAKKETKEPVKVKATSKKIEAGELKETPKAKPTKAKVEKEQPTSSTPESASSS
ncbi:MAG: Rne/Rng family ribonuclease [Thiotrichaceae bacterium]|nr:Rne/Rng family ribonuclease [Thiotrichaceae bacterium]